MRNSLLHRQKIYDPNDSALLSEQEHCMGCLYNLPIHIGRNCWLGAGVIVVPGVTIGDNTVIGAGSVVTKDIPANVVAVGNPCHILRPINEHDQEYYHRTMKIKECNI